MGKRIIKKIFGASEDGPTGRKGEGKSGTLEEEAVDTVGTFLRAMGEYSFTINDEADNELFGDRCTELARHVKNGADAPSIGIVSNDDGSREWPKVRTFFIDRRKSETEFVGQRMQEYREVVSELVAGLREIGKHDNSTEQTIRSGLGAIETAVDTGAVPAIRQVLSKTIEDVGEALSQQKLNYESQIEQMNDRMASLRRDLVTMREEMQRDPLTEVYNRGGFDSAIQHTVNMRFIANQPGTLVLLDVDFFKQINDNFGHAAGDAVLKSIATCLERSFIRRGDLVARFGGDEFAVILNDTTSKNAVPLIERFVERVAEVVVPFAPEGTGVTCSIGYTDVAATDDVQSLLERADRGLYQAKEAGRNCARLSVPSKEAAAGEPNVAPVAKAG